MFSTEVSSILPSKYGEHGQKFVDAPKIWHSLRRFSFDKQPFYNFLDFLHRILLRQDKDVEM